MGSSDSRLDREVVDIINQLTEMEWSLLEEEVDRLIEDDQFDGNELHASVYVFMKHVLDHGQFVKIEVEDEIHDMVSRNPPTNNRH